MKKKFTGKSGTAWINPECEMLEIGCSPTLWDFKQPGFRFVRWTIKPITKRKARK